MKLSDIEMLKKMVSEFEQARRFRKFLGARTLRTIEIKFIDLNNMEDSMTVHERNTEARLFCDHIYSVVGKREDLLRTKLALLGIDDFEDK